MNDYRRHLRKLFLLLPILCLAALVLARGAFGAQTDPSAETTTTTLKNDAGGVDSFISQMTEIWEQATTVMTKISIAQWFGAFLTILAGIILQRLVTFFLKRKVLKWAQTTRVEFDAILVQSILRPAGFFPVVMGLILAGFVLGFRFTLEYAPEKLSMFGNAVVTMLVLNAAWLFFNLVDVVTHLLRGVAKRTETALDDQLVPLIGKALKVLVILIAIVTLGSWVGGPFRGVLAGLSLGGLAFALAAKDTIANLFGYFVIFADRPFILGDRVKILGVYGDIELVGLRSTKIRTREGTLTSIPNSEVATASIENYSKRPSRRCEMTVGLTYESTADQMEIMVKEIRGILSNTKGVQPDTHVVGFQDFGDSSLNIRIRFFTDATSLAGHLKGRQAVNVAIMRAVEKHGLSIAFPTRTLYLRQEQKDEG